MTSNNWADNREGGTFLGALTIRDGFKVGEAVDHTLRTVVTVQVELCAAEHVLPVVFALSEQQARDLHAMLAYILD